MIAVRGLLRSPHVAAIFLCELKLLAIFRTCRHRSPFCAPLARGIRIRARPASAAPRASGVISCRGPRAATPIHQRRAPARCGTGCCCRAPPGERQSRRTSWLRPSSLAQLLLMGTALPLMASSQRPRPPNSWRHTSAAAAGPRRTSTQPRSKYPASPCRIAVSSDPVGWPRGVLTAQYSSPLQSCGTRAARSKDARWAQTLSVLQQQSKGGQQSHRCEGFRHAQIQNLG